MCGLKRIYYDGILEGVLELGEEHSRYLKNVLRLVANDKIEILSYKSLAVATISLVGKKGVSVRIDEVRDIKPLEYTLNVYQCIAKREYMDNIIEKYAELGVTKVTPIVSTRSLQEMKDSTLQRFHNIAVAATLQSENEHVMEIADAVKLNKIELDTDVNIMFHESIGSKVIPAIKGKTVSIIIGAEGGFTDSETEHLLNIGFSAIHPIDVVLKAETAAILFAGLVRINI